MILVTGAGGQVGQETVQLAKRTGQPLVGLDHGSLDITDQRAVEAALEDHYPRVVINAAGLTDVDRAEGEPALAMAINAHGAGHLAEACAQGDIPLIHLSTDYVFGASGQGPYGVDSPPDPLGAYGKSKLAGEEAVRRSNARHIILRIAWVFSSHHRNFVLTVIRLAREGGVIRLATDQRGAPTHGAAVAEELLGLCGRYLKGGDLPWGTYHYTGTPEATRYTFGRAVLQEALARGVIASLPRLDEAQKADFPNASARPADSVLDLSGLGALGIQPRPWREGLGVVLGELQGPGGSPSMSLPR